MLVFNAFIISSFLWEISEIGNDSFPKCKDIVLTSILIWLGEVVSAFDFQYKIFCKKLEYDPWILFPI